MELNTQQVRAINTITKFLSDNKEVSDGDNSVNNMLLLGPGGSGKTTVIVNAFDSSDLKIAFCAFTNKATQVLRDMANKFGVNFIANFNTIHKLYCLTPSVDDVLTFTFDVENIAQLEYYDVIIFDECSTISRDLYGYIMKAWEHIRFTSGKMIKHIFLGDYWQLPPVNEKQSYVFSSSIVNKWTVAKLSSVMRANNDDMKQINTNLITWINNFKTKQLDDFVYPYCLIPQSKKYVPSSYMFHRKYIRTWRKDPDVVILTYSKSNCDKTNNTIQSILNKKHNRESKDTLYFYEGDRCCIDRPIEVSSIVYRDGYVELGAVTGDYLYNGDIFDILRVEDVNISSPLNKINYITNYFPGQVLSIRRINDDKVYQILYIEKSIIEKARIAIKRKEKLFIYNTIMKTFNVLFPVMSYGYCITVYKSQGSEWRNVFVNLSSIHYCLESDTKMLFKTTYTALTRASENLYLFWIN